MEIAIRKPRLEPKIAGIPQDFFQVREYFNKAVDNGSYPYIPRRNPITLAEINNLWVPALDRNICFVAENQGRVIGSATVLYDPKSNEYEQKDQRKPGELAMTVNPEFSHKEVGSELIKAVIAELRTSQKQATLHTHVNWVEEIEIMKDFGYQGKLVKGYQRYKEGGLSGDVFEYSLP